MRLLPSAAAGFRRAIASTGGVVSCITDPAVRRRFAAYRRTFDEAGEPWVQQVIAAGGASELIDCDVPVAGVRSSVHEEGGGLKLKNYRTREVAVS